MAADPIVCPSCSHNNPPGSRFCNNCGNRLSEGEPVSAPAPPAEPVPPTDLEPGATLGLTGRYVIERAIGKGGFGRAYLARDTQLNRHCVVKLLALNPEWKSRTRVLAAANFRREAELLVTLNTPGHPNIPEIYEYLADMNCLVMKFIEGQDLSRIIQRNPSGLPVEDMLPIVRDVCSALAYMHSRSPEPVLHRDIKPSNILIDRSGRAWVIDFGLSKATDVMPGEVTPGATQIAGTFGYTPPEQWRGQAEPRSDIYALAATLHTLLTGYQPPFKAADLNDILRGKKGTFPPIRQFVPEIDPAIERLIVRGMAFAPAERPSATDFLAELEVLLRPASSVRPIQAPDGTSLTSERELVTWIEAHWEEGARWLNGDLPNQVGQLWGRQRLANDLRAITGRNSHDPYAALDEVLTLVDPQGFGAAQARLTTDRRTLDFGALAVDERAERPLTLINGGRRYIRVQLQTPHWLRASTLNVALRPGHQTRISFVADMRRHPNGGRIQDEVQLRDRSGASFRLPVTANVSRWRSFLNRFSTAGADWSNGGARALRILEGHGDAVWGMTFTPDGQYIVSGAWDNTVRLWQVEDGAQVLVFRGHEGNVLSVAVSPGGHLAASGGSDESMRIWRLRDGTCLTVIHGPRTYFDSLAFSADGQLLAACNGDKMVRLWRVSDGALVRELGDLRAAPLCLAFSPDSAVVAVGYGDGSLRFWRTDDGAQLGIARGPRDGINSLAYTSDGYMLASGCGDGTVALWHVNTLTDGTEAPFEPILLRGHENAVRCVAFHPRGDVLASGGTDGTVRLWHMYNATTIQRLSGHRSAILRVAFSPDGRHLGTSGGDGRVIVWGM